MTLRELLSSELKSRGVQSDLIDVLTRRDVHDLETEIDLEWAVPEEEQELIRSALPMIIAKVLRLTPAQMEQEMKDYAENKEQENRKN